jgi:hypothetical protein
MGTNVSVEIPHSFFREGKNESRILSVTPCWPNRKTSKGKDVLKIPL